jgi:hypothetical protein
MLVSWCQLTGFDTCQTRHGSLNVPIEHHPTIRYMVYNGYYKVMSNIPKMGQLPTPARWGPNSMAFFLALSFSAWPDWIALQTTVNRHKQCFANISKKNVKNIVKTCKNMFYTCILSTLSNLYTATATKTLRPFATPSPPLAQQWGARALRLHWQSSWALFDALESRCFAKNPWRKYGQVRPQNMAR